MSRPIRCSRNYLGGGGHDVTEHRHITQQCRHLELDGAALSKRRKDDDGDHFYRPLYFVALTPMPISGNAKTVLSAICAHANKAKGYLCWASTDTLAEETGVSFNTVRKCIHDIAALGLITVAPRRNRTDLITVHVDELQARFEAHRAAVEAAGTVETAPAGVPTVGTRDNAPGPNSEAPGPNSEALGSQNGGAGVPTVGTERVLTGYERVDERQQHARAREAAAAAAPPPVVDQVGEVLRLWNERAVPMGLAHAASLSKSERKAAVDMLAINPADPLATWRDALDRLAEARFLRKAGHWKPWVSLLWVLSDQNLHELLRGKFRDLHGEREGGVWSDQMKRDEPIEQFLGEKYGWDGIGNTPLILMGKTKEDREQYIEQARIGINAAAIDLLAGQRGIDRDAAARQFHLMRDEQRIALQRAVIPALLGASTEDPVTADGEVVRDTNAAPEAFTTDAAADVVPHVALPPPAPAPLNLDEVRSRLGDEVMLQMRSRLRAGARCDGEAADATIIALASQAVTMRGDFHENVWNGIEARCGYRTSAAEWERAGGRHVVPF